MRISVDNEKCEGHGQCNMTDADLFTLDSEGYCDIGESKPVSQGKELNAEMGAYNCPVGALVLDEDG
ncbi:MAG TPA: ferredoxin [Pseudonocardia sp.]|nr:ferredoxin [Pseudonocardia sp.]